MTELDDPAALDFTALLHAGDHLVCSQGVAEPVALTKRLAAQARELPPIHLFVGPGYAHTFAPEHGERIAFSSYCGTDANARLHAAGVLDIVPSHASEIPRLFRERILRCDVALISVSEDGQGHYNLGLGNDYVLDAARHARLVIMEACSGFPWVEGADLPPDIRPHIVVRTRREPLALRGDAGAATEDERELARQVAGLIGDGATLQVGLGRLPELVLQELRDRRDLGVHSAVVGDAVADLMEAGVITNARKPGEYRGVSVGNLLMGTQRVYRFAHRNPAIRLAASSVTHALEVIRTLPDFVALLGAIEVDLTGQVSSEVAARRYVGAVGGQLDFVRAANAAPGGRALIMLPSTVRGGSISRIVPRLTDGVVTTPRSDVQWVVTEWGVAHLLGRSLRERALALIAIAHPRFREDLQRQAREAFGGGSGRCTPL